MFPTFLLSLLLVFGLCMAGLTLAILLSWNINLNVDARGHANVPIEICRSCPGTTTPCLPGLCSPRSFSSFRRLLTAWKKRSRERDRLTATDRIYVVVLSSRG